MNHTELQNLWISIQPKVIEWGQALIFALLIFFIGKWIAKAVSALVEKGLQRAKFNATLASFTKNIAYFGVMTFVVIAALNKLGIETNSFIAVVGAAGLAVGLALQGSLANFAAGVMLIILHPFKVGDFIEAGGATGTVKEIQIFSTIMTSPENKKIIMPNAKITADKIIVMPGK
jgi:small conductance mechanosensitive channel